MSTRDHHELMQILKILVVSREKDALLQNGMSQMHRIGFAHKVAIQRNLHIVASLAKLLDQQLCHGVVIKV